jgi:hypothetical protein
MSDANLHVRSFRSAGFSTGDQVMRNVGQETPSKSGQVI